MIYYEVVFWFSALVIFYTFVGYPLIAYIIFRFDWFKYFIRIPEDAGKVFINPKIAGPAVFTQKLPQKDFFPFVSMIIAAYNEEKFIEQKIKNCLELDYPKDRIEFLFVTDGSSDKTPEIVRSYSISHSNIKLFHMPEREGKIKKLFKE